MPMSVTKPFDMNNLSSEEQILLFGEAIHNEDIADNKLKLGMRRTATLKEKADVTVTKRNTLKLKKHLVDDIKAQQDCQFLNQFVIKHNNACKSTWDVVVLMFIAYSCVVSTYK